jgi:hypothetical protein
VDMTVTRLLGLVVLGLVVTACGGPTSTRVEALAWLDDAEVAASEFLVTALGNDGLGSWQRHEYLGGSMFWGGECTQTESTKVLEMPEGEVLEGLNRAAADGGLPVTYTSDVVCERDGTTSIEKGGVPLLIEIGDVGETGKPVVIYINTSHIDGRVRILLATECYPDPVDGTFPDE